MTKITAVTGKAVVTLKPSEELSKYGLYIPETVRKAPSIEAHVVASQIPDVAVGDLVLLSGEYAGSMFTIDGVEYVTVVTEEVLAVLG